MSTNNVEEKLIPVERPGDRPAPLARPLERGYGYGYGYAGAYEDTRIVKFREYLRIIRKNKWIIATITVVATTLVALAAYRVESDFVSSATLQMTDPNPNLMDSQRFGYNVYDFDGKNFKTQLQLLQMPDLIRQAVIELDLEHNPDFFSSKPRTLKDGFYSLFKPRASQPGVATSDAPLGPPIDPKKPLDDETIRRLDPYVGTVIAGLDVNEIRGTKLITISFRHHNPEIAAKVTNAVAEVFIKADLNQRVDSKATASDFLQQRIAELQTQIRSGEERLLNYGKTHEILSLEDADQNTVVQRLEALNKELLEAEAERRSLEATREALAAGGGTQDIMRLPTAQADQGAVETSKRLSDLRQQLLELQQRYTDEYPGVVKVKEQIGALEADMEKIKTRLVGVAETQYQAALGREKMLQTEVEKQRSQTMEQNEAAISYRIIQQEVETNKKLMEMLLQRSKEVDISAASEKSLVVLKNRADVPGGPAGPNRDRWIMMAFLLSLGAGVGLAFAREYLDQTIRSIEDIDRVVRLPSLGVIPALSSGSKKRARRKALASANGAPAPGSDGLITALEARSSAAEAYRQLRTSVLLSSAGHPSRLLLVTSSQPREGKTTTAVNTAISLAQTGASVLIIDCDMRKPRVHKLLNASNLVGVSLYLSGQNEDLGMLVQEHQIPNLSVLPCGPTPPNPAELLGSDQMRKLLVDVMDRYDHIVIDSPPVISFADPVILSTMVDGVILVVRGGYSHRNIVMRSRQLLDDVGAKIYGVVLNDADMKGDNSYYYYGSYYHDYYASEGDEKEAS